ncbi:hypothetical protein K227x_64000 [Rubripirellula lacrimiformis]|uniref:Exonuclease domain-containing protein n=1 Tax=Rubripirellula lacrimiformis TaxID=1930273 RepID=A0A517NLG4_9BACT|nr:3'-5' exonuclease [Rubripirellula lacrimiformis]QDT07970.1 hypothetical protein K227x_64000 [Rubripirellula lacrimiformis]
MSSIVVLAIDTETHDSPSDWRGASDNVECWPRIVEIGWVLAVAGPSGIGEVLERRSLLIRPSGWKITAEAFGVHGIAQEQCETSGVSIDYALDELREAIQEADLLVAHNIDFDWPVIRCESIRDGNDLADIDRPHFCTMKAGTPICAIPSHFGLKWASLGELHGVLFGTPVFGAHRALADADACLRCYAEIERRAVTAEASKA